MIARNELICKNCGAPIDTSTAQGGVVRCNYCRSAFTLPKEGGAAREFLYQGEHELDTCEFDRAYSAYRKAAETDPNEPEAYFGMALASFKVQYIKDGVNNCLQPICHEVTDKPFKRDPNFCKAVSLATPEQRLQYDRKAKDIDYIANEFLSLRDSGIKYDCFLCTKVTDGNGGNTRESYDTLKIYNYLKSKGYSPFYSEQEISERTGVDYEALILYALQSAKCMLIVCRNESYLRTPWVENEYKRFLSLINDEQKASDAITFVFGGTPIERLPGRNGKIQGIDLDRPDAYSRILDYVEKHTEKGKNKRDEEDAERKKREDEQASLLDAYRKQLEEMKSMLASGNFAQPAPSPAPAQPADENTLYDVKLMSKGQNVVEVIKTLRSLTGLGIIEAKQTVDSAPVRIAENLNHYDATKVTEMFAQVGATAIVIKHQVVVRPPVDLSKRYTLILEGCGVRKIDVIKGVRAITGCGLIEGKHAVEHTPTVLKRNLDLQEAERLIKDLNEAGATARME